jgi:hypothetical protein
VSSRARRRAIRIKTICNHGTAWVIPAAAHFTMKKIARYSHLNGYEWMMVHRKQLWQQIEEVIDNVDAEVCRTKRSKEQRKQGRVLYSPRAMNKAFKALLNAKEWHKVRTDYWVTDDFNLIRQTLALAPDEQRKKIIAEGRQAYRSNNETDFQKDRVAIEVQFGKYSFIDYDLFVKHLAFYVGNKIDVGIEILPMKSMQGHMSSGPGYYERALYDIARQGRGVPAVPLVLIGVAP